MFQPRPQQHNHLIPTLNELQHEPFNATPCMDRWEFTFRMDQWRTQQLESRVANFLEPFRVPNDIRSSFVRVSHQQYRPDRTLSGVFRIFPSTRCGKCSRKPHLLRNSARSLRGAVELASLYASSHQVCRLRVVWRRLDQRGGWDQDPHLRLQVSMFVHVTDPHCQIPTPRTPQPSQNPRRVVCSESPNPTR